MYFSGRPNPRFKLIDAEITKSLLAAKEAKLFRLPEEMPIKSGYSGLLVQDEATKITELLVGAKSFDLQMKLIYSMPDYSKILKSDDINDIQTAAKKIKFEKAREKRYAPQYDDREWNGRTAMLRRRFCNSNYNYANEKVTNNFAVPGFASGINIFAGLLLLPATIENAAMADGMMLGTGLAVGLGAAPAVIPPPADNNHLVYFWLKRGKCKIRGNPFCYLIPW